MIKRTDDIVDHVKQLGLNCRLVVVAADDANILETVRDAWAAGIVSPVLIGSVERMEAVARKVAVDLKSFEVIDCPNAAETIARSIDFAREGCGDIIMKGNVRTADLMKELLRTENGLRTGRLVSHVAAFSIPGESRIMLLSDAGINIAPDALRKRDIILNATDVAHVLGIAQPRVALLSFLEKIDNQDIHPAIRSCTEVIRDLLDMAEDGRFPTCTVEGPFALDNAISPESVAIKGISGEVAGRADILIAHDIHMGNAIYKALQVWVKAIIAGVIVGSRIPVVVPSRNDSNASKLQSIGLAMLLSSMYSQK